MKLRKVSPSEIERESFNIIWDELHERGKRYPSEVMPTILRVIHATADFEYADTLYFSDDVIDKFKNAIRRGAHIVTDTNMTIAGINRKKFEKYGGMLHCFMADKDVEITARQRGITRAAVSMEKAAALKVPMIFSIGNAPTALIRLWELMKEGEVDPEIIIGVPVGFVNVIESKKLILDSDVPQIVNRGRKGGSTVAAAIINSVLVNMH